MSNFDALAPLFREYFPELCNIPMDRLQGGVVKTEEKIKH